MLRPLHARRVQVARHDVQVQPPAASAHPPPPARLMLGTAWNPTRNLVPTASCRSSSHMASATSRMRRTSGASSRVRSASAAAPWRGMTSRWNLAFGSAELRGVCLLANMRRTEPPAARRTKSRHPPFPSLRRQRARAHLTSPEAERARRLAADMGRSDLYMAALAAG
jgi:hypothetical protein